MHFSSMTNALHSYSQLPDQPDFPTDGTPIPPPGGTHPTPGTPPPTWDPTSTWEPTTSDPTTWEPSTQDPTGTPNPGTNSIKLKLFEFFISIKSFSGDPTPSRPPGE